jgi:3-hydroxy-3-methylglutaryl CoA synthase/uncharacterized OB-fold protein
VAAYDEDTTSMAVEAAQIALRSAPSTRDEVDQLIFSTVSPAYLDKSNAAAIHAALRLKPEVSAFDAHGSGRSVFGSLRVALRASVPTLIVASDIRAGLPGSTDESQGGDAAVAFLTGASAGRAELLADASETDELLDRWRLPSEKTSRVWEERFAEQILVPMAGRVVERAVKDAGISLGDVDRVIVGGTHSRAVRRLRGQLGKAGAELQRDLSGELGDAGAVGVGVGLAAALDEQGPGALILVVGISDGADALLFRTGDDANAPGPMPTIDDQLRGRNLQVPYTRYLSWRGLLDREPPRRPDPARPSAPPSHRAERWKFGFVGSECRTCGGRYLPPQRTCLQCGAVDAMEDAPFAERTGRVATYTVDRLAYSPSPPVIAAVIDFDGGGRFSCELTDVDPEEVQIGSAVEMTFRRLYTAGGVHNYFWKARPTREGDPT